MRISGRRGGGVGRGYVGPPKQELDGMVVCLIPGAVVVGDGMDLEIGMRLGLRMVWDWKVVQVLGRACDWRGQQRECGTGTVVVIERSAGRSEPDDCCICPKRKPDEATGVDGCSRAAQIGQATIFALPVPEG